MFLRGARRRNEADRKKGAHEVCANTFPVRQGGDRSKEEPPTPEHLLPFFSATTAHLGGDPSGGFS